MIKDKVYFAQKYGVPERDIVPEFLPIYIAFDHLQDQQNRVVDKIKGSVHTHQHYYDKGKPLDIFLARWGWGVWAFIGMLIVAFLLMFYSENRRKLEKLESVMRYNDSTQTYFIDSQFYKVINKDGQKGVVLNP